MQSPVTPAATSPNATWTVEWRVRVAGHDGTLVHYSERARGARAAQACVERVGFAAWAGEFRVWPPSGRMVYTEYHRALAWDAAAGLPEEHRSSLWAREVRAGAAVRRFRHEVRASVLRAVAADVIRPEDGRLVIDLARSFCTPLAPSTP